MPPEMAAAMAGGPEGAMPPGAMPGGPAEAEGGAIDPEALMSMLAEMGISPEQLIALLQGGGAGGGAGGEPPAAEVPPAPPAEKGGGEDEGKGKGEEAEVPPEESKGGEKCAKLRLMTPEQWDKLPQQQKTAAFLGALRELTGAVKSVPAPAAGRRK